MVSPMRHQQTLAHPVSIQGVGLHSGAPAVTRLLPAPAGAGLSFVSADHPGFAALPARFDQVIDTQLATTLGNGQWRVSTVEHLLAALVARGIDNAVIEVSGAEIPVLDGSAALWMSCLEEAGLVAQSSPRRTLVMRRTVEVCAGDRVARLQPADGLQLSATIDFAHPSIGQQQLSVRLENGTFGHELAWARTFGFLEQVEAMHRAGLALGGGLDNAVVYDQQGVVNPDGLRGPHEPVRHKLLDMLGDLALVGMPIEAHFEAIRPGHALNQALVRALFAQPDAWEIVSG